MPNEETTIPPTREPNTPRTFLNRAMRYAKDHPDKCLLWGAIALAFFVGYALG